MDNKENTTAAEQAEEIQYVAFSVQGESYDTLLTNKYMQRKPYKAPNLKKITSFIPGTIKKVHVKPGAKVRKGDKLLVLDAMKMFNDIISPINGRVDKVNVKQGSVVTKNEILIELR